MKLLRVLPLALSGRASRFLGLGLGCAASLSLTACGSGSKTEAPEVVVSNAPVPLADPVVVLGHFHGSDATMSLAPGVYLIDSAAQAGAVKSDALANAIRSVDWASQQVLVASLGEQPTSGYWTRITGAQREGSTLYVQYTANRPDGPAATVITHPYCIAVIERQPGVTQVIGESRSTTGQAPPS
ncbi:MAG: protease complex subunit PrcB family protein [Planctomycetota bacterium]